MSALAAIVLFGILIFVHELGHFLFAKLLGVKVLKFSLGFGPKLLGMKYGDTEYRVSVLPLGGYVKMLGEEPGVELAEEEKPRAYNNQPSWKKAVILISGSFFNIGLTYLIFVGFLASGFPVNIPKLDNIAARVDKVVEGFPAEASGIRVGDTITAVDGKEVYTWYDMTEKIMKSPGVELVLSVSRGAEEGAGEGEKLELTVTPEAEVLKDSRGNEITVGRIGIVKEGAAFDSIVSGSILAAPLKGVQATYQICGFILKVIKQLFTGALSVKTLGGPITIFHESGKAATLGILPYLMFMALISANLGVLNLLPVPMLDGGQLFVLSIEAARGKPLSERVAMGIQQVGLVLLLFLMVFVIYIDVMRYYLDDIMKLFGG